MIRIDGSQGEGGGQILRSSLSLAMVTGSPFQIERIRAGRERPGLLRQHLTSVQAAAAVCGARVDGAALGSTQLTFTPGPVRAGEYRFAVGTAGSATLVLQTILPALLRASAASSVVIEGGTHNQAAPPFDFLERTFVPLIERMGPRVRVMLERYGFYPAGGGRIRAELEPAPFAPLDLTERGEINARRVRVLTSNLPSHIAVREIETASSMLTWPADPTGIVYTDNSACPGNAVMVEIETPHLTEVFTAFGERGVTAENVATAAARQALEYLASDAATGEYLADQLLLPIALAGSGRFTATKLSLHARTNIEVIERFLPRRFRTTRQENAVLIETA